MKHKYAPIGFIYLLGLICASFLNTLPCFILAAGLLAAFGILLLLKKRELLIYPAVMCIAALVFGLYGLFFIDPARALIGTTAEMSGKVTDLDHPDNDNVRLTVEGSVGGVPVKLALYTPDFGAHIGDTIAFTADFSDFRDNAEFSETQYNFSKGIFLRVKAVNEPQIIGNGFSVRSLTGAFSTYLSERIDSALPAEEGGLLRALFLGDRSGLSPYLSVMLKRAGIAHMTCVSGMHFSLIINLSALVIGFLPKRRVYLRFGVTAALIILLMLFFGMTASVMRSGTMLLIYYSAGPLHRKSSAVHTLGLAAMLIVLLQPCACRDMGLWMSILGTFGIAAVSPYVCRRAIYGKRFVRVKKALISSVCAVVCTLPAGALCFGGVSPVSAVSSLLVYPMFFAALLLLLLTAVTGGAFAEILLLPAGAAARGMTAMTGFLGSFSFSYITFGSMYSYLVAVTAAGLLLTVLIIRNIRYTLRFILLSVCVFMTVCVIQRLTADDDITIDIYSDGSDALLIIESRTGVSAVACSDGIRLCRELFSATAGKRAELVCITGSSENELSQPERCGPMTLHPPDSPDAVYDVSGEYTVTVQGGKTLLDIRGTTVALLPVNAGAGTDIAVIYGYRKEREFSDAKTEILCDKRYYRGAELNAFYDRIRIIINDSGETALEMEGEAA